MDGWVWPAAAAGVLVASYALFVALLVLRGRCEDARAWAGFVPDCMVLFARLLRDPLVERRLRYLLVGLVAYLALPFDFIPDFVPVAGQLDDAILVGLVLRRVLRGSSPTLVSRHWPGPQRSLELVLRVAGAPGTA